MESKRSAQARRMEAHRAEPPALLLADSVYDSLADPVAEISLTQSDSS